MNFTLDQLNVFVTAAGAGSFSAAARKLGRAQSAVSTAVSNLEIDLGISLFDRGGKFPRLTPEGELFVREAQRILSQCRAMAAKAEVLAETAEPRLRLAVSETLPDLFFRDREILAGFEERFPETELELLSGALNDVWDMIEQDRIDFGVMLPTTLPLDGAKGRVDFRILGQMDFIPVTHPGHRLARGRVDIADLEGHRQIEITSRGQDKGAQLPIYSSRVWWVEDEYLARRLLRQGIGWGLLPRHLVEMDIESGWLEEMDVDLGRASLEAPVIMVWARERPLGQAGQWLIQAMESLYVRVHGTP